MKNYVCIALTFIALLASCSENGIEEGGKYQPKDYSVKGKVEKGPFVSGSTINLQPMDENNDALPLLTKIKNNGFYSVSSSEGKLIQDEETIYGLIHNVSNTRSVASSNNIQVISYPEIMLLLAECEEKTGNESTAQAILQDLASKKNITFTSTDVLHRIKEVRKSFTNMPGFFAYMKRAGLAQSELGLQSYQLLFPIPYQELLYNYNLTQNPGYDGGGTRSASRTRTIIKR